MKGLKYDSCVGIIDKNWFMAEMDLWLTFSGWKSVCTVAEHSLSCIVGYVPLLSLLTFKLMMFDIQ